MGAFQVAQLALKILIVHNVLSVLRAHYLKLTVLGLECYLEPLVLAFAVVNLPVELAYLLIFLTVFDA